VGNHLTLWRRVLAEEDGSSKKSLFARFLYMMLIEIRGKPDEDRVPAKQGKRAGRTLWGKTRPIPKHWGSEEAREEPRVEHVVKKKGKKKSNTPCETKGISASWGGTMKKRITHDSNSY